MPGSILVGYATRSGSTREIAQAIGETLRAGRREVDVRPLKEVRSLEGYQSVVLGAPFFMFRWHKDAVGFLSRHKGALATRPTAVFALGPFHDEEKEWNDVRGQLARELTRYPWFSPIASEVFGGKFDPAGLGFPWSMIPALKRMPPTDIRDWAAIRKWAQKLSPLL